MIRRKIRFALIGAASAVIVCAISFASPISTECEADLSTNMVDSYAVEKPLGELKPSAETAKPTGTRTNPSREDIDVLIQQMDLDVLDQIFKDDMVYTPVQFLDAYVELCPEFQAVIDAYYG